MVSVVEMLKYDYRLWYGYELMRHRSFRGRNTEIELPSVI
jgi:hypothetical protein